MLGKQQWITIVSQMHLILINGLKVINLKIINKMDIVEFQSRLRITKLLEMTIISNPLYADAEKYRYLDLVRVDLIIGDLSWFGIGYNEADAVQTAIDKACKYFRW